MKNQKTIQEVIDINELMNEEIFPTLSECNGVITEDYLWNLVADLTIGHDLWDETNDAWWYGVYAPILKEVKLKYLLQK